MENAIDQLLAAIDHRGGDATGFVAVGEDEISWQKASCNAFEFYKERRNIPWNTRSVLLHTRMATQGSAAFPENNHPVRRGSVYIVHNGHIYNDREVFKTMNRERYGQVDSEAIAALIAKHGIMKTHKAMEEITGAAAIGVVDETRPGLMALARGSSSPLMFYRNEDMAVFASTKDAIKRAWTVLYGTAPKDKNIEDIGEGITLYLDKTVSREKFKPDDYGYFTNAYSSKSYVYKGGSKRYADDKIFWREGDDILDGSHVTISSYNGAKICRHSTLEKNCEVCNPDDKDGSFLPVKRNSTKNDWINAKQCELCDKWFAEDELTEVKDIFDTSEGVRTERWLMCDDCTDELSEVISDCEVKYPETTIHRASLDEIPHFTF